MMNGAAIHRPHRISATGSAMGFTIAVAISAATPIATDPAIPR